ncbi:MAG TPA: hypothetical protein VGM66_13875 [Candidatus Udaeobacter sp.]|jgi:hypothetical protein
MKLTIRRNQSDVKGMFGGHKGVKFSLFGKCDVSEGEKALIEKYKVGEYQLAEYKIKLKNGDSIDFNITVNGIITGKHVETDDISELQKLEESMKEGCRNLKEMLAVMTTFGGEEIFEI